MSDEVINFGGEEDSGETEFVGNPGSIDEINSRLKTVSIKGKPYVEVTQRVLGFRELYPPPLGRIETQLLQDNGERCVMKALVYVGDQLVATGHAYEVRKGMINATSYLENCETSAVGRALGILGIGSTESIASADEMRAIEETETSLDEKPAPYSGGFIASCAVCGMQYRFESPQQLTTSICSQCGNKTFRVV